MIPAATLAPAALNPFDLPPSVPAPAPAYFPTREHFFDPSAPMTKQLQQLQELGITDHARAYQALCDNHGNFLAAVDQLFS